MALPKTDDVKLPPFHMLDRGLSSMKGLVPFSPPLWMQTTTKLH